MTAVYPAGGVVQFQPQLAAQMLPQPAAWAPPAGGKGNCQPGLEALVDTPVVSLVEEIGAEVFSNNAFTSFPNRYSIRNSTGQQVYLGLELSMPMNTMYGYVSRMRQVDIQLSDASNKVCLIIRRLPRDECFVCCGCMDGKYGAYSATEVRAADESLVGRILHVPGCCEARLQLRDAQDNVLFYASSDGCAGDLSFDFHTGDKQKKGWSLQVPATAQQRVYNAQNYTITFPPNADATLKALLMAGCIFADFTFYGSHHGRFVSHYRRYQ